MQAPRVTFEKILRPALAIVFIMSYWATYPHSTPAAAAQPTTVVIHETPCHYRERIARHIPAYSVYEGKGEMAYVYAHLNGTTPDAELADFWAALDACDVNEPVAKWDWDAMYTVGVEFLGD
jgi:hypothetical protein